MNQKPFTVMDLADRWGCTRQAVYAIIKEGKLRTFRVGDVLSPAAQLIYPRPSQMIVVPSAIRGGFSLSHGLHLAHGIPAPPHPQALELRSAWSSQTQPVLSQFLHSGWLKARLL